MELGWCTKTFRCLFIFFNVIFAIVGIATIGLGIFLKVNPFITYITQIKLDGSSTFLANSVWIIIGIGALVVFVGFCGCVGAAARNKYLLGMYIALSLTIPIVILVFVILAEKYLDQGKDIDHFRSTLKNRLQNKYSENATEFTKPWDYVQKQYHCCGVRDYRDYDAVFTGNDKGKVPISCCVSSANTDLDASWSSSSNFCPNQLMYSDGCSLKLSDFLHRCVNIGIVADSVIVALAIIGIIIAACLCRRNAEKEQYSTL
ncbi:CD82 antigen-like [Haliotis rufescens]|uniref:CD82 antigen-like n=1 Tax=Haliotis rufescens TaxID=6454 RepID=UPI00201E776B|nr:CD82 antigen-like [Haliotis rufescens]